MPLAVPDLDAQFNAWAAALGWPLEQILRLALAAVLGALVGLEREVRGRQAGFRTNLLVCLGCALVMVVSISFAHRPWPHPEGFNVVVDPARVAYGVMAGIGFLGAGAIIKTGGSVRGLTTAAALWCVAAVGLACGLGLYLIAVVAVLLVLGATWFLAQFEKLLPKVHYRTIVIRRRWHSGIVPETIELLKSQKNVDVRNVSFQRMGNLETVDIHLTIAFNNREHYLHFEQEIDRRDDCQVISASSEV